MDTSFALLGLLQKKSSYGYDLKHLYDSLFGREKPLAFGQVYATLSRLVRDGKAVIEKTEVSADGPDRKRYAITQEGSAQLHTWLQTPLQPEAQLQAALFAKVILSLANGTPAEEYLDKQRRVHLQRMRELTAQKQQAQPAHHLLIDYALFHIEADLRWIDLTEARLQSLATEVAY